MTKWASDIERPARGASFARCLVPLTALTTYLLLLSALLAWLLRGEDDGVTGVFADRSWKLAAGATILAGAVLVGLTGLGRRGPVLGRFPGPPPRRGDWLLILLPLAPVAQYILNNQDILPPNGALFLLGVFGAAAAVLIIGVPAALRRIGPVRPLMFVGLAFTFTVTNMAALAASRHWFGAGSLGVQWAVLGGVFVVSGLLDRQVGHKALYAVVIAYFMANGAAQVLFARVEEPVSEPAGPGGVLGGQIGSRQPHATPGIYLLIYDAYVSSETLAGYGIDNVAQEKYLVDRGFILYPDTYSVANNSVGTMSRVLNASMEFFGDRRAAVSGKGVVPGLLQMFGYETYGLFPDDYFFQVDGANWDVSYPGTSATHLMLLKAVFMGEFRFDLAFDSPSRDEFQARKVQTFGRPPERPRFVYLHDDLPGHSQNSGECRPDETELFAARLKSANRVMQQDLAAILANDPGAIVVVAGDHGPYLTKNCYVTGGAYDLAEISRLDLQDRYGTFLAIRWPDGNRPPFDRIVVLQDIFPIVFAYLFDDPGLLGARVKPATTRPRSVSGAVIRNGVITGGIDDGEPLFIGRQ